MTGCGSALPSHSTVRKNGFPLALFHIFPYKQEKRTLQCFCFYHLQIDHFRSTKFTQFRHKIQHN